MALQNERNKCADREKGLYYTRRAGDKWLISEFTDYGWKAPWSGWFQNDSDFSEISDDRIPYPPEDALNHTSPAKE